MKLDELKTETTTTNAEPELDLSMDVPAGVGPGLRKLDPENVTVKEILPTTATVQAKPYKTEMEAKAMELLGEGDSIGVGLQGLAIEMAQIQEKGEELREAGVDITYDTIDALKFNPNSEEEIEKRKEEYIPGKEYLPEDHEAKQAVPKSEPVQKTTEPTPESEESEDDYEIADEYVPAAAPVVEKEEDDEPELTSIDDSDFEDLDEDDEDEDVKEEINEETEAERKASRDALIAEIKSLLNTIPTDDVIDFSNIKISSKKMRGSRATSLTVLPTTTASHGLYTSGRKVFMTGLSATEIANFNPAVISEIEELTTRAYSDPSTRKAAFTLSLYSYYDGVLRLLYDHVSSAKPASYKLWAKTIAMADIDDLVFCAYKATYEDVGNVLIFDCPSCRKSFAQIKSTDDMYEIKDDPEVQKRWKAIMGSSSESAVFELESGLFQVSSQYVFKLGVPTLDTFIDISSLDTPFVKKYQDLISLSQYIKEIFWYDKNANTLVPVESKVFDDDPKKTVKAWLKLIGDIVYNSITLDQRMRLQAETNKYDRDPDIITYHYPETVCPKCGKKVERLGIDVSSMVFTRYQLVDIINS